MQRIPGFPAEQSFDSLGPCEIKPFIYFMQRAFFRSVRRALVGVGTMIPFGAFAQNPALEGPAESGLPVSPIIDIVSNTMLWILAIFGFLAIIGFVISGILYLTAAGNDKQMGTAKSAMIACIFGVIVALMGYVIIQAVDIWLSGSSGF